MASGSDTQETPTAKTVRRLGKDQRRWGRSWEDRIFCSGAAWPSLQEPRKARWCVGELRLQRALPTRTTAPLHHPCLFQAVSFGQQPVPLRRASSIIGCTFPAGGFG